MESKGIKISFILVFVLALSMSIYLTYFYSNQNFTGYSVDNRAADSDFYIVNFTAPTPANNELVYDAIAANAIVASDYSYQNITYNLYNSSGLVAVSYAPMGYGGVSINNVAPAYTNAGFSHACIITDAGNVYCEGSNRTNELLNYTNGDAYAVFSSGQGTFWNGSNYLYDLNTCVYLNNGTYFCQGARPVNLTAGYPWKVKEGLIQPKTFLSVQGTQENIIAREYASSHTCYLNKFGTGVYFCDNYGSGYCDSRVWNLPINNVKDIDCDAYHSCNLYNNGTIQCKGSNVGFDSNAVDVVAFDAGETAPLIFRNGSTNLNTTGYNGSDIKRTYAYAFTGLLNGVYYLNATVCDSNGVCNNSETRRISVTSFCGNGTKSVDEQCDDGNRISGDGCDMYCMNETSSYLPKIVINSNSTINRVFGPQDAPIIQVDSFINTSGLKNITYSLYNASSGVVLQTSNDVLIEGRLRNITGKFISNVSSLVYNVSNYSLILSDLDYSSRVSAGFYVLIKNGTLANTSNRCIKIISWSPISDTLNLDSVYSSSDIAIGDKLEIYSNLKDCLNPYFNYSNIVQISMNGELNCSLFANGNVSCPATGSIPAFDYGGKDAIAISSGSRTICIFKKGNNMTCFFLYYDNSYWVISNYSNVRSKSILGNYGYDYDSCTVFVNGSASCSLDNGGSGLPNSFVYSEGDAIMTSVNRMYGCVLTSKGNVYCGGNGYYGCISSYHTYFAGAINYTLGDAIDIKANICNVCILRRDGSNWCSGNGSGSSSSNPNVKLTPFYAFMNLATGNYLFDAKVCDIYNNCNITNKYSVNITGCQEGMPGDGSINNPCQITSWTQLDSIRLMMDYNYTLMKDLNASDADYEGIGNNWKPIGFYSGSPNYIYTYFNGSFNGNNKIISDLIINKSSSNYTGYYVGLFGLAGGVLSNIKLVNVNISGYYNTGGLAGSAEAIYNSSVTGIVTGKSYNTGGLAGSVTNITHSSFIGNVTSLSDYTGGLVGRSKNIQNSFSSGNVKGNSYTGGLTGQGLTVNNSYSTANVNSSGSYTGGLVGQLFYEWMTIDGNAVMLYGKVLNSYSTGRVNSSSSYLGGLIGYNYSASESIINDSFWDNETSGRNSSAGGVGKTTADMKNQSTFTNWDFENIWRFARANDGYPSFRWPFCGDEFVEGNEECDDQNINNTDSCTNICKNAICGDGIIRTGVETCDDSNNVSGDGCSSTCIIEVPSDNGGSSGGSGGSSAGGAGGASNEDVKLILSEDIFRGYRYSYVRGEKINFTLDGQMHEFKTKLIMPTSVLFSLQSTPKEFTLNTTQTLYFDLNENGKYNLSVTLNNILDGKADVTLKLISNVAEEKARDEISDSNISVEQSKVQEEKPLADNSLLILWIICGIIILVIIFIILFKRLNKKSKK